MNEEPREGDPTAEESGSEWVPEDDAVIGRAVRRSLLVLAGAGLVVAVVVLWLRQTQKDAPEQSLEAAAPAEVVAVEEPPEVRFTDMTAAAGIEFLHINGAYGDKLLPETMGGGVAVLDYDGDGDSDLLFVNSSDWPHYSSSTKARMALYRNDGGWEFADVTAEAGLRLTTYGMGVAVGDYDGDGDEDLYITAVGENYLLRNDRGVFVDATPGAGVAGATSEWSTSAAFFDQDQDGDLDLFVCNYVRWSKEIDFELDFRLTGVGRAFGPPQSYGGSFPYFFRNQGDGTFVDESEAAGVQVRNPATNAAMAKSLAVAPVDIDGDSDLDLLVANDTVRNFFFRNDGVGGFEEVGEDLGLAYDRNGNATGAMGIDSAFYRNDRNLGFMIGNFANEMSSVYVSQDDPEFFVDEAIGEGIGAASRRMLTFGLFLFDYDLDGRLDLLQANGHIEGDIAQVDPSQSYLQPSQLFWNAGSEAGFVAVRAETTGDLAREMVGRGAAYGDFDGDGDLDLVITQIAGSPLLLRNEQGLGHHWLRVRLTGPTGNPTAIGAWVELKAAGVLQRRQVMPTRSYLSQVEPTVTFGLGAHPRIEALRVHWPDGQVETLEAPAVDREHVVEYSPWDGKSSDL